MSPVDEERFWRRVDRSGGPDACWPWMAGRDGDGYGRVLFHGTQSRSHRGAYTLVNGPIPAGMHVLHRCDNPPCCNVTRCLWLGTNADNMADRDAKGRTASGDRSGARLHPGRLARGETSGSQLHPERLPRGDRHWTRTHPESVLRGERNGRAKLTESQVIAIRARAARGESIRGIARDIGISFGMVGRIVRRECWDHVECVP